MIVVLDACCGLCWSIAYIAAIIIGFRNRTYCIPALSICMNFSWELLMILHRLGSGTISFFQLVWLLLDFFIILTWQLYSPKRLIRVSKDLVLFAGIFLIVFFWAYIGQGWKSSVFVINLIMSVNFIVRMKRDQTHWTSNIIAVTKLLGTFSATVLNGLIYRNMLILWLGGLCLILDIYYMLLLRKEKKRIEK